jgi:hypothetical protein
VPTATLRFYCSFFSCLSPEATPERSLLSHHWPEVQVYEKWKLILALAPERFLEFNAISHGFGAFAHSH